MLYIGNNYGAFSTILQHSSSFVPTARCLPKHPVCMHEKQCCSAVSHSNHLSVRNSARSFGSMQNVFRFYSAFMSREQLRTKTSLFLVCWWKKKLIFWGEVFFSERKVQIINSWKFLSLFFSEFASTHPPWNSDPLWCHKRLFSHLNSQLSLFDVQGRTSNGSRRLRLSVVAENCNQGADKLISGSLIDEVTLHF